MVEMIEYADGTKEWYLNGKRHRTDGPAIEHSNGSKGWWLNGKRHREDGPAVEYADGTKQWYLNGVQVDQLVWWLKCGSLKKAVDTL